ncbi:MAG: GTP cyclohydrolase II [Pseudomonadota bacterium]
MSSQRSDAVESLHSPDDRRARACAELRRGAPVVLETDGGEAWLLLSAEVLRPEIWETAKQLAAAPWTLAISDRRARTLNARAYDGDLARIALRPERAVDEIRAIADPALALDRPMLGPHQTERDGPADAHRAAITLCKRAKLLPAALLAPISGDSRSFAAENELARLSASDARAADPGHWREIVGARVPITLAHGAKLKIFRRAGWGDEHYAFEIGEPPRSEPVLARLHSACVTGDIFGSLKCDCGPQLQAALRQMAEQGGGVLVYLLQEGRGIGLENKMRAYRLQDQGFDTVEANHRLGFQDDERLLSDGAEILRAMGFSKVRLLTNNPKKLDALSDAGLEVVERAPLIVGLSPENARYLEVKARKSGHLL